ncbi:kelch motif protein (macronuclear) [Tetrahymena thermophila SB210]|uniref:Kelch motif protein n=1 Tax=Tetrahymena thermophila (strain SB210) TaxID=312017 RepID=W7XHW0_TETTS|nr:kelch motif protein [Tetrahymena thermophila SB210]EWS72769.1 kelch motif protein [Tetrahymena thermophila SB210]|eukprot:XP_012654706.1 kelch motif protein [Tetrahymena thermophila SB210]
MNLLNMQQEQIVGLEINSEIQKPIPKVPQRSQPTINIVYKEYQKEQNSQSTQLLLTQNTIENLEISSLSFLNSEVTSIKVNYLNFDECDENIYGDYIKKPYTMILVISEPNIKEFKKSGLQSMEKFVDTCRKLNLSFLIVYCPNLDASQKKSRGLESKIQEVLNEIVSEGENKLDIQRNKFLKLIDIDPNTSSNDSKEFYEFCKREFQMLLRMQIKESVEERISEIENNIFSYNEKKNQPDWNYQVSLINKERLIYLLNSLGLHQEALQQYEECNNTIYELIMRGRLNIKQQMEGIEKDKVSIIPVLNVKLYDNYEEFTKTILQKGLHFFKFYQILIRKIILQMTQMQFIQELMDRLQYFLRFIQSNIFSQMDCESDNVRLFQNIWIILTINQIIEFFVEQKKIVHYSVSQQNDIDYNIILLREIQLKSMQKIAELLFSIKIEELSIQSIEQEFEQLSISIKTNKLRKLKSFIQEKDISQLTVLQDQSEQATFIKTYTDSTLFFNSYTNTISDQIVSLHKLKMFKKQFIYQINLLKFKILAKEIKIPYQALALECEEAYETLESWPNLLVSGLIYKMLFYKNHCVVEQFRKCCIKLVKIKVLTLEQRNLILNILREDNEKLDQSNEDSEEILFNDNNQTLEKKSSQILSKYYADDMVEDQVNTEKEIQKKSKKKYIKISESQLCYVEKLQLEKTQGENYEAKLKFRKNYQFSLNETTIEIKLESSDINRTSRYSQDEYDKLRNKSFSNTSNDDSLPIIQPVQYHVLTLELNQCDIDEQENQLIIKEIEIKSKGCYNLKSVSIIVGQYKFKLDISQSSKLFTFKINLPSLNICSLLDQSAIEIPYYHEIPVMVTIIDHNFSNTTHLKFIYNHEILKLEKKYICLTQGADKSQYIENRNEIVHKDIIQLTKKENNVNKMAIIVYFKATSKNLQKIDYGTFTNLTIKLIEDTTVLDQFEKQAITITYYKQDIKKLDIYYNINITNYSDYKILFSSQNQSEILNLHQNELELQKNEQISKTINPQTEKVFVTFKLESKNLQELGEQIFIDDLSFLKNLKIEEYFLEKEISKNTILKDSTLIKNPKLDIFINNVNSHCFCNEILNLEINVKILRQNQNKQNNIQEDKYFYTLLAQNKRDGNYLLLGQTQISTQNKKDDLEWKLQILPIKCGVFYLPDFEVVQYSIDENQQLCQEKIQNNQYILRYYSEPIISVTSDSSKIKNSSAFFI